MGFSFLVVNLGDDNASNNYKCSVFRDQVIEFLLLAIFNSTWWNLWINPLNKFYGMKIKMSRFKLKFKKQEESCEDFHFDGNLLDLDPFSILG